MIFDLDSGQVWRLILFGDPNFPTFSNFDYFSNRVADVIRTADKKINAVYCV